MHRPLANLKSLAQRSSLHRVVQEIRRLSLLDPQALGPVSHLSLLIRTLPQLHALETLRQQLGPGNHLGLLIRTLPRLHDPVIPLRVLELAILHQRPPISRPQLVHELVILRL